MIGQHPLHAALFAAFVLGTAFTMPVRAEPAATSSSESADYLISVTAGGGAVLSDGTGAGCYTLTLNDADHVIWFTDRPFREAHSGPVSSLTEGWNPNFGDNPPNADLQLFSGDGNAVTVILELGEAPVWNAGQKTLSFSNACAITIDGGTKEPFTGEIPHGSFPMASLFIDGAKLFAMNACYSGANAANDTAPYSIGHICMHQWGSYPASCGKIGDRQNAPGKKCSEVCNSGDCPSGCFSDYDGTDSTKYLASSYHCK
jgi:hypothetical protein